MAAMHEVGQQPISNSNAFVVAAALAILSLALTFLGQVVVSFHVDYVAEVLGSKISGSSFSYNMWQGVAKLYESGSVATAVFLALFSGVWPYVKILLMLCMPLRLLTLSRGSSPAAAAVGGGAPLSASNSASAPAPSRSPVPSSSAPGPAPGPAPLGPSHVAAARRQVQIEPFAAPEAHSDKASGGPGSRWTRLVLEAVSFASKWSFFDVWVVAALVASFELDYDSLFFSAESGTSADAGVYLFLAANVLSLVFALLWMHAVLPANLPVLVELAAAPARAPAPAPALVATVRVVAATAVLLVSSLLVLVGLFFLPVAHMHAAVKSLGGVSMREQDVTVAQMVPLVYRSRAAANAPLALAMALMVCTGFLLRCAAKR